LTLVSDFSEFFRAAWLYLSSCPNWSFGTVPQTTAAAAAPHAALTKECAVLVRGWAAPTVHQAVILVLMGWSEAAHHQMTIVPLRIITH
jgi:hypothetical protein